MRDLKNFLCFVLPIIVGFFIQSSAFAEGFATSDLNNVLVDLKAFEGGDYKLSTSADRLTIFCDNCNKDEAIHIIVGKSTDGTEDRVRSGETTIKKLEEMCQSRSPECKIIAVNIGQSVGWISTYPLGNIKGSTGIFLMNGNRLIVRSISSDSAITDRNMNIVLETIVPQIIGVKK